jgi:hypothetical protein
MSEFLKLSPFLSLVVKIKLQLNKYNSSTPQFPKTKKPLIFMKGLILLVPQTGLEPVQP